MPNDTAEDLEETETAHPEDAFIDRMVAKFEKQDAAALDKEDGIGEDDEETDETDAGDEDAADSDDSTEEHTDEDTSADDPDGDTAESDEDSEESDKDDHTKGDEGETSEESTEGADADEDEGDETAGEDDDEEEDEEPLSEEFTEAATRLGIPLTLDDIPEGPARTLVAQKIKGMDSAFTKAMQEQRAYRTAEVKFRAEEQFRKDNPALAITEILQAHPELEGPVAERIRKLEGDEDQKTVHETLISRAREKAEKDVRTALDAEQELGQKIVSTVTLGQRIAAKHGLPWAFAETALALAISSKGPASSHPFLSDEEVADVVTATAKEYSAHVRARHRDDSKDVIKQRTANRKVIPGAKHPASGATPRPTLNRKRPEPKTEEERQARMLESARRIKPGVRDE